MSPTLRLKSDLISPRLLKFYADTDDFDTFDYIKMIDAKYMILFFSIQQFFINLKNNNAAIQLVRLNFSNLCTNCTEITIMCSPL